MLFYRGIKQGRYRRGWGHRFGFVPVRNSSRRCIWIHAVSMGEVNATQTVIEQLKHSFECDIVISTTTDTGYDRALHLYGRDHMVFFYPFDFSWSVKRALKRIKPNICILMELEVWHNFTYYTWKNSIPTIVANGRISSGKGFPRYKRIAWLVRPMFGRLDRVLAQDQEYAERFSYLGVPNNKIITAGSLKYDTAQTELPVVGQEDMAKALNLAQSDRLWVAGSTGPGEEEAILSTYRTLINEPELTGLKLVIVPRKPERFDDVARLIEAEAFKFIRYSQIKTGQTQASGEEQVILGDTMGDLRKFYALAHSIFVGRSLTAMGGSDMIEAVALAKPTIVGPYTENFSDSMAKLRAGKGIIEITRVDELPESVKSTLLDSNRAQDLARCGRQVVIESKGATARTIQIVKDLLKV